MVSPNYQTTILLSLLSSISKWQTFSTDVNSLTSNTDSLDIDALLSTPIEPILQEYFKPLEKKSSSKKFKQKLAKTQNDPTKVKEKPFISQEKKERRNRLARIRRIRYTEKLKEQYGYTRKDVGIRKHLQSLLEKGTINRNQRELLTEMNKKYRIELDRNNENFRKRRKRQENP